MRSLNQIFYDPEHIRLGNIYIFVNPGSNTDAGFAEKIVRSVHSKQNSKFHVFLFSQHVLEDGKEQFISFVDSIFEDNSDMGKLVIHIPNHISDLAVLCKDVLNKSIVPKDHIDHWVKYALERNGCRFRIPGDQNHFYEFTIDYLGNDVDMKIEIEQFTTAGFHANAAIYGTPCAIKNYVQAMHPDLFKDKILEAFKLNCPPGILSTFKNDQEIWDYITENGEWNLKEIK